jgi:uncharacterized NAD-dependent epimerase/dehydratase family protein
MNQRAMDGTAIVLCEGAFGTPSGKTAHGLVRYTGRYRVLGIIDSRWAGRDAGEVLDGHPRGIPVFRSLTEALRIPETIQYLVIGLAPDGGRLPDSYRPLVKAALRAGLHVDSGLHQFLGDDPEFGRLARKHGVRIRDVRRPPPREQLHFFTGKIEEVTAVRIAVLGTDSAVGKRTTALELTQALTARGCKTVMVGTGQTAWMQGIKHCIVLDALINDFVSGEVEHAICRAFDEERPQAIILEGQGCVTHPAYPGGFELIAAGRPRGIVLQHAPRRLHYDGFPQYALGPLAREMQILELLSQAPVIALTLNHEGMAEEEIPGELLALETRFGRPAFDVLRGGAEGLARLVIKAFDLGPAA